MAYHIVLNRPTDLQEITRKAADFQNPRHSMAELARELNAHVHDGTAVEINLVDRLAGKVTRTSPRWWATARALKRVVAIGDVVFCTGEDIGFPVGALVGGGQGPKVAVMVHHVDSIKKTLAFKTLGLAAKIDKFFAVTRTQIDYMTDHWHLTADKTAFVRDQTDTKFFSPSATRPQHQRPIIISVGLERRDYSTLAVATQGLDVEVKISGYSADTKVMTKAFPKVMPANMTRKFYSWPDLRQLYQEADLVVVSLFPNRYAAGVQGLMEGLACGKPVIVTQTEGLADYLPVGAPLRTVPPNDAEKMRRAIEELIRNPIEREQLSFDGANTAAAQYSCETYVRTIATHLRSLSQN